MNDTPEVERSATERTRLHDALIELANRLAPGEGEDAAADRVALLENLLSPGVCRRLGIYRLPPGFLLSVVIPVFNEAATVEQLMRRVRRCGVPIEIIVVDDGSTDGTDKLLDAWRDDPGVTILLHETNRGKGAALKTGLAHVRGNAVIIQDADLEYDPLDYPLLLQPIVKDWADVVYGSRFSGNDRRVSPFWHRTANRLITLLSNMRTNLKLSDVETCYKVFRREILDQIVPTLGERGFGIELELTAKAARLPGVRFYELPIRYSPRSYAQGKKLRFRDALRALWCAIRY